MCVNGCGLVIATPIGHHYACQKLIYGPIRLKFGIWSPSDRVSIINYMLVWQCVWFGVSYTHRNPTRLKFEWLLYCYMLSLAGQC